MGKESKPEQDMDRKWAALLLKVGDVIELEGRMLTLRDIQSKPSAHVDSNFAWMGYTYWFVDQSPKDGVADVAIHSDSFLKWCQQGVVRRVTEAEGDG